MVWVVDSGDRERMKDCRDELWSLLGEEVSMILFRCSKTFLHEEMNLAFLKEEASLKGNLFTDFSGIAIIPILLPFDSFRD